MKLGLFIFISIFAFAQTISSAPLLANAYDDTIRDCVQMVQRDSAETAAAIQRFPVTEFDPDVQSRADVFLSFDAAQAPNGGIQYFSATAAEKSLFVACLRKHQ